jgi:hypothetical protein
MVSHMNINVNDVLVISATSEIALSHTAVRGHAGSQRSSERTDASQEDQPSLKRPRSSASDSDPCGRLFGFDPP